MSLRFSAAVPRTTSNAKLPAVRTLPRYLIARFLQFFLAVAFVAVLSIAVVELLLGLDRMLAIGDGWQGAVGYLWLRLASEYASYILPVTAFLASFLTTALLAYSREWTALKAGGVSLASAAAPLLLCGTLLGLAAAVFHETVAVSARQAWNTQRDGDENIRFRKGSFWYHRGSRIYSVAEADRSSRTLQNVRIFERDERGRLERSITAKRVDILDGQRWRFHNALIRDVDPDEPTAPAGIARHKLIVLEVTDPPERALLSADPAALRLARLREHIEAREGQGADASSQRALLYARFGDWFSIALLVAAAIPIGLSVERTRSLGRSAGYATATLVGYFALRSLGTVLSVQAIVPAALAVTLPLAALASFAAIGFARAPR